MSKKNGYRSDCMKYTNQYHSKNEEKRNLRERIRKQRDMNYKLICNTRSRTYRAFKAQKFEKRNKIFHLLGYSQSFFRRWIIHQVYGNMNVENYGSVWNIDHCYPLSKIDPSLPIGLN